MSVGQKCMCTFCVCDGGSRVVLVETIMPRQSEHRDARPAFEMFPELNG